MCGPGVKIANCAMEIPHFSVKIRNLAIFPTNAYGLALSKKKDSQSMNSVYPVLWQEKQLYERSFGGTEVLL